MLETHDGITAENSPDYYPEKPVVKLIGNDGNAFAILGACQSAARRAGWTEEHIDKVIDEMTKGDYDALLATAMEHFEVE